MKIPLILITGLFVATITISVWAQDSGRHCAHHRDHLAMKYTLLESVLDLTEEQSALVKEIHRDTMVEQNVARASLARGGIFELDPNAADYDAQVNAFAEDRAADLRTRILKHSEIHAKIFANLTPEQQQKLKAFHEKIRNNGIQHRRHRGQFVEE